MIAQKNPPKTPGELLNDMLLEKGYNQTEAATRLNVTRPYLNGVINGKYSLSADLRLKLQPIVGVRPDFWTEAQRTYDLWRSSPEGRAAHMAKSQEELYLALDVRGQHTLLDHEITAAISARAIDIAPFDVIADEDRILPSGLQLTFPEEAQLHSMGSDDTQTVSLADGFKLKRHQMLSLSTREQFTLPRRIRAVVNGLTEQWSMKFVHCFHERVREPGSSGHVIFAITNAGPQDLVIHAGEPCLSLTFEYLAQEPVLRRSEDSQQPTNNANTSNRA